MDSFFRGGRGGGLECGTVERVSGHAAHTQWGFFFNGEMLLFLVLPKIQSSLFQSILSEIILLRKLQQKSVKLNHATFFAYFYVEGCRAANVLFVSSQKAYSSVGSHLTVKLL